MLAAGFIICGVPLLSFFGMFFVQCGREYRRGRRVMFERLPDAGRPRQKAKLIPFRNYESPGASARRRRIVMGIAVAALVVAGGLKLRAQTAAPATASAAPASSPWQYGGFLDAAYLVAPNDPANHLFRNRGTTFKVNEPVLDMAAAYIRKAAAPGSRWGAELTVQAGEDAEVFGFSATAPKLAGADGLRHLGPTDVSYLAAVGKGLTIQGGIFSSLIGYDSLYAKDNFTYTRPWGADTTPYLMLGVNASYPFTEKVTATAFVVNGYWHLADANRVPSSGGQLAYKATPHVTLKQTAMYGPHQPDTSLPLWRFLSDSIAEWKRDPVTVAFEYQLATEKVAAPGQPRAYWSAAQLPMHWVMDKSKHWSLTLRPEFAWDSDGRWTGFPQTIKAVTTTVEYRLPYRQTNSIFRVEYRHDDSRGAGGGFFENGHAGPGSERLTPTQNLVVFGLILTFDGQIRRK
ncbi:MAG TPA: outer membrane beta-barrel protein [Terriglobales bacterium]|nr:outer membrane beta-barrel protein [Terriglobales bacterium]